MAANVSVLKEVRAKQTAIFKDLATLARKYGPEVFRIGGQRYFKTQTEQAALRREIASREKELQALQQKAAR